MALEMRIYEELTDIDPKVIAGLTWRQLGAVGLIFLLGGGLIAVLWLSGIRQGLSWAVLPVAAPIVAWAWAKPSGLRFEVWLKYMWIYESRPKRRLYANEPVWRHDMESPQWKGARDVATRKRKTIPESGH